MDAVRAILAREFPGREPSSMTAAARGNRKRTTYVTFPDGTEVVVQVADDAAALRTEAALARAVRERTGVPVPRVRAAGSLDGAGYTVVDRATGEDLHERFAALPPDDRRSVARTFGRVLAELHDAFAFDAYGPVTLGGDPSTDVPDPTPTFRATGPPDWPEWFATYAQEGVAALPDALGDLRDPLLDAVDPGSLPDRPPSRLYPWDLRPGNALVSGAEVTAVLDWGEPLAAPPGLALAKVDHLVADWYVDDPAPLRAAIRSGYRAVRPVPAVPRAYRVAAVVRSAVDSRGEVTRPRYPERTGEAALAFHRDRLTAALSSG